MIFWKKKQSSINLKANCEELMKQKYLIRGELYDPILFGDEDSDWVGDGEDPTCGDFKKIFAVFTKHFSLKIVNFS